MTFHILAKLSPIIVGSRAQVTCSILDTLIDIRSALPSSSSCKSSFWASMISFFFTLWIELSWSKCFWIEWILRHSLVRFTVNVALKSYLFRQGLDTWGRLCTIRCFVFANSSYLCNFIPLNIGTSLLFKDDLSHHTHTFIVNRRPLCACWRCCSRLISCWSTTWMTSFRQISWLLFRGTKRWPSFRIAAEFRRVSVSVKLTKI